MEQREVVVRRWQGAGAADEADLYRLLVAEGLQPYRWSNDPGGVYAAHSHDYHKIIYVARGSITFGLPASGGAVTVNAGDRLELPPGVVHDAVVGDAGVVCFEAHRTMLEH